MEDNNIEAVETDGEAMESSAFDEGWGDAPAEADDFDLGEDEETVENQHGDEADSQTQTDTEDESKSSTNDDGDADGSEDAGKAEDQPDDKTGKGWKLKHNGEEVDADDSKMVELAQKGLDYDRVREERDRFKNDHPKYAGYEAFLQELADSAGTDIPGLMESTRASLLVQKAKNEGKTLSEAAALEQVRQAAKERNEKQDPAGETSTAAARQASTAAFLNAYPDVKAADIPIEVWADAEKIGDLTTAYARWENKKLKAENETLRQSREALEQDKKNKERSTGSRRSAGTPPPKDDFDEAWDSF